MEISVVFFASNQTTLLKAKLFIFNLSEDESLLCLSCQECDCSSLLH